MTAILKEDPPEMADSGIGAPPALERLVRHCLEKRPEERFQSAKDVAFDLETVLTPSDRSGASPGGPRATRPDRRRPASPSPSPRRGRAAPAAFWLGHRTGIGTKIGAEPSFARLTFSQGHGLGGPLHSGRQDRRVLGVLGRRAHPPLHHPHRQPRVHSPEAAGRAPLLACRPRASSPSPSATATRAGWAPAPSPERRSWEAEPGRCWRACGKPTGRPTARTSRSCGGSGGLERLEFPAGKVLYETGGFVSHIRFSPKGDRIAFADHPCSPTTSDRSASST